MSLTRLKALAVADPPRARREIVDAIVEAEGNATRAAQSLGVSHRSLCRIVGQLGAWADVDAACERRGIRRRRSHTRE